MKFLLLLLLLPATAFAKNWSLFEPKEISIEAYRYVDGAHDPYLKPVDRTLLYGSNFNLDLSIFRAGAFDFYWDNTLHFDQSETDSHIKHAGWQYEFGLTVLAIDGKEKIQLFNQHHSRHILEEARDDHFPVYDRFGIRLIIMSR